MKYVISKYYVDRLVYAKKCKLQGELKENSDGFVYLDLPDDLIKGFRDIIDDETDPPESSAGAHISVIYPEDYPEGGLDEIGEIIEFDIDGFEKVNPDDKDLQYVWFITVNSPRIENIRQKYGLSKKHKGHQFHITVATKS